MPEGRMLQRRISESKKLGSLNSDSARLLYTWLIPWMDCESRHSADPDLIKGRILPKCADWDIGKVTENLYILNEVGLIRLYRSNGETFLQLSRTIQKINKDREAPSNIPAPDKCEKIPIGSDIAPANSGPNPANSLLIKVNESKVNESKEDGHPKADGPDSLDKEFDLFWEAYPNKVNKTDALKAFLALRRKKIPLEQIAAGFNGYVDYLKHQRIYKKFEMAVMYPATFLRNDKWREHVGFKYREPL